MLAWVLLAAAIVLGLYIMAGGEAFAALDSGEIAYVLVGAGMVALYILSLGLGSGRRGLARGLRYALTWAMLFLLAITGYAYRDELRIAASRVTGELTPPGYIAGVETGPNGEASVRLRRRTGGHFSARVDVEGTPVTMLVDTGATTVVLKPLDAEKAGIDVGRLSFTIAVDTANGTTYAAPVRLKSLAIGPIEVRDVEALVAKPGTLKESLLGMSFLKRLRSYEFSGEYLTLRG